MFKTFFAKLYGFDYEIECLQHQLAKANDKISELSTRSSSLFEETEQQARRIQQLVNEVEVMRAGMKLERDNANKADARFVEASKAKFDAQEELKKSKIENNKLRCAKGSYQAQVNTLKARIANLEAELHKSPDNNYEGD